MSNNAPKRRWFRFSLRTFFVVLTGLCLWLGWQVNQSSSRKRFLDQHSGQKISTANRACLSTLQQPEKSEFEQLYGDEVIEAWQRWGIERATPTVEPEVSAFRRLLGDEPIELIVTTTQLDFERAKSLFPEAIVLLGPEGDRYPKVNRP